MVPGTAPKDEVYDRYSRLAGELEPATAAEQPVRYRKLANSRPVRDSLTAMLVVIAGAAFFAFLLHSLSGELFGGRSDFVTSASTWVMIGAILIIEGFRQVNMSTLSLATWLARDPVPVQPRPGMRVAFLTSIVPSKEPVEMVVPTLEAALRIRHDGPFDVWILDEGDDDEVRAVCARLGVRHFSRKGVERYNQPAGRFKAKTKHGNYNAWVDAEGAGYDVFVSVDPDHRPHPSFCERLLGYFRDPDVAFVVGPQVYGNCDNIVTKSAESGQYLFHSLIQRMGNRFSCAMLVGTNNAVRIDALNAIGGLRDSITEDMATSLMFHRKSNPATGRRWKSVYTPDVLAVGEGPSCWTDFFSQQHRWSRGTFEVLTGDFWTAMRRLSWGARLHYGLITTYYPSAALSWVLGLVNCSIYLLLGTNAVKVDPHVWMMVYADLALMQTWLYKSNRRHNISPHEKQGTYGLAGMWISLLSAPVYASALKDTLLRSSASFVVTPKGASGSADRVLTFRRHLQWLVVIGAAFIASIALGHDQTGMRVWAVTLIALCLMPLGTWLGQRALQHLKTNRAALRRFDLPESTSEMEHA